MHIISNIALITINETLFVQLLSFLIFLFIINRIMFRPLQNVMNERVNYMDKVKMDTVDTIQELEDLTKKLKVQESEVKAQAFELKRELEESGSAKSAEIFASTRKEIDAIKEKTEMEINVQISEARKHIQEESEALAVNIMEKLLDRRLAQ
ncbi:MAG: ATP synthase F0 subunit B [Desulfobacteraceae bacterium]|nr:ATP synthase F0 subunit B [Desulfobacteraceae bacterium]